MKIGENEVPDPNDGKPVSTTFCDFCRCALGLAEERIVFRGRTYHKSCAEKANLPALW